MFDFDANPKLIRLCWTLFAIIIVLVIVAGILAVTSYGQIVVADETPDRTPIPISIIAAIPDGAQIDGPGWIIPGGLRTVECQNSPRHIVAAGEPGEYEIKYQARWIHLGQKITVVDVNGVEQTFIPFLGSGTVNETATFKITGEPNPNPPTPGPTPGKKWVGLIWESSTQNQPEVVRLKLSTDWLDYLKTNGHQWAVIDQHQEVGPTTAEIVRRAVAAGIPRLVVVSSGGVELLSRPPAKENTIETAIKWMQELDGD